MGDFVEGVRDHAGGRAGSHQRCGGGSAGHDGATCELRHGNAQAPYLVVDIGGGSTEFVLGNDDGVIAARSVDIGCVRE